GPASRKPTTRSRRSWCCQHRPGERLQNGQRQVLVKMLYNEKEIAFKTGCQPYRSGSHYYDFEELKRCYGYNG
ncbi:hypothetical protein, partial [Aeromonas allosaccharophila]